MHPKATCSMQPLEVPGSSGEPSPVLCPQDCGTLPILGGIRGSPAPILTLTLSLPHRVSPEMPVPPVPPVPG